MKCKAYSIMELSITLLIVGIMSISLFSLINTLQHTYKTYITKHRQQIVMRAIGQYTAQRLYLPYPCPSEKFNEGTDNYNVSITFEPAVNKTPQQTQLPCIGVIPWKTLGLSKEMALDGYGNPMTYVMHPKLGRDSRTFYTSDLTICSQHPKQEGSYVGLPDKTTSAFYVTLEKYQASENEKYTGDVKIERSKDTILDKYDNYIQLVQYDSQGNEITLYSQPHEQIAHIQASPTSVVTTSDCVAVVLISHNNTGGHFDKDGNRTEVTSDNEQAQNNAQIQHNIPLNEQDHIKIYLQSKDPKVQQTITYTTRFGIHAYDGPVCTNHAVLKTDYFKRQPVNSEDYSL